MSFIIAWACVAGNAAKCSADFCRSHSRTDDVNVCDMADGCQSTQLLSSQLGHQLPAAREPRACSTTSLWARQKSAVTPWSQHSRCAEPQNNTLQWRAAAKVKRVRSVCCACREQKSSSTKFRQIMGATLRKAGVECPEPTCGWNLHRYGHTCLQTSSLHLKCTCAPWLMKPSVAASTQEQ